MYSDSLSQVVSSMIFFFFAIQLQGWEKGTRAGSDFVFSFITCFYYPTIALKKGVERMCFKKERDLIREDPIRKERGMGV